jgi:hypothetical protein
MERYWRKEVEGLGYGGMEIGLVPPKDGVDHVSIRGVKHSDSRHSLHLHELDCFARALTQSTDDAKPFVPMSRCTFRSRAPVHLMVTIDF